MSKKKISYLFLSILLLISGFFLYIKAQDAKSLLHFVQMSDTHLNYEKAKDAERLLGSSEKLLTDAVEEINEIKDLDFVLVSGDLVDIPEEKLVDKYIEITMSLKYPLYVLLGNHDVSIGKGLGKKGFIKKFTENEGLSFTGEMAYYSFSPNENFTVICLDGTTDKVVTAHGQIEDEKQFKWLKGELEKNKDKFVIITLHFPLIEPYKSQTHFFLEPDKTRLLDLIDSYKNVVGVFTGHYHAARLIKVKNKVHNSCPAVVQWPNAFREIIVTQKDPKYLNVEFKWHLVNGSELREVSKSNSQAWRVTEGTDEDKENSVKFRVY